MQVVKSPASASGASAAARQRQQEAEREALLQRSLDADRDFLAGFAGIDDVGPSSHVRLAHAADCLRSHFSLDNPEWYHSLPMMLSAPGCSNASLRPLLTRLASLFQADKFVVLGPSDALGLKQQQLAFQSRALLRLASSSVARAEARQASSSSPLPACFSRRPRHPARPFFAPDPPSFHLGFATAIAVSCSL